MFGRRSVSILKKAFDMSSIISPLEYNNFEDEFFEATTKIFFNVVLFDSFENKVDIFMNYISFNRRQR